MLPAVALLVNSSVPAPSLLKSVPLAVVTKFWVIPELLVMPAPSIASAGGYRKSARARVEHDAVHLRVGREEDACFTRRDKYRSV